MSPSSLYYLAEGFYENYNAGIVRKHQEHILQSLGFKPLYFEHSEKKAAVYKLARIFRCFVLAFSMPANSLLLFHFPIQATVYKWLLRLAKLRGIKTVVLIIDLDGIRDQNEKEWQEEIKCLGKFDWIVAHNEAMKLLLQQALPLAKISCIEIFDYPHTGIAIKKEWSSTICFAGNISKSGFTKQLGKLPGLHFNIYGLGYEAADETNASISYKGAVDPGELPAVIAGSFGLVWDGNSMDECDPYLRYNNPHKFSLYLAAGLPVIVWKDSAIAQMVEQQHIGFLVGSLYEIEEKINAFSAGEYELMRDNAQTIGKKIKEASFLKKAMKAILAD